MTAVHARVFANTYRDSVELMQIAAELEALEGIDRAGLVMATPANREVLAAAGLHALAAPGRGFLAAAVADVDVRTTAIAGTLLRYAARGEFAERIHRLLDGLLGPDDRDLPLAIARATAWGATSGTDCLVGVLYGLDLAARPDRTLAA